MADYGLKISQPGYSVGTALDKQLVFSSKFKTFTIFATGSGSVTIQNDSPTWTPVTLTVNHNLGYKPIFIFYSQVGSGFRSVFGIAPSGEYCNMPFEFPVGGDGSIIPWVEDNTLKVRFGGQQGTAGTPENINYKYYIYLQSAE